MSAGPTDRGKNYRAQGLDEVAVEVSEMKGVFSMCPTMASMVFFGGNLSRSRPNYGLINLSATDGKRFGF